MLAAIAVGAYASFAVAAGAFGLLFPARLARWVRGWRGRPRILVAALLRLCLAAALWFAAPDSRAPLLLHSLACISAVAALGLVLVPPARADALVARWSELSHPFIRAWSALSIAVGALLLWALV